MRIETSRLTLRPLRPTDADWITTEIANPKVQVWLTSPPHPYRRTDAERFIAETSDDLYVRAIDLKGVPQGLVTLSPRAVGGFDLGYWLAESAWGRGVMTEAAHAMLHWHFAQADTDVTSGWITGNDASRNVLAKLGFQGDAPAQDHCHFRGTDVVVEKVRMTAERWHTLSAPR